METYLHTGMFVKSKGVKFKVSLGESMMELYLQFGYGMMEHCRSLITRVVA